MFWHWEDRKAHLNSGHEPPWTFSSSSNLLMSKKVNLLMRLQELWKRWCIMLFTIVHQCSHSYKQAYWHSNASLRPALTEYWLIIMNHKGKQTDVMDLWSPPRRNLVQTTCIWTMRSLSYQRRNKLRRNRDYQDGHAHSVRRLAVLPDNLGYLRVRPPS